MAKLALYNHALRNLGEEKLATLTDDVPKRHYLDDVYDNNFIQKCLEEGLWNFAMRTAQVSYEPSIEPDFGYRYAFEKPSDYVITANISANEYFNPVLLAFDDEGEYWYCDLQTLYIKYVSDDASYGSDLSKWTESFEEYASWVLAMGIVRKLTGDRDRIDDCKAELKKAKMNARSKDALNQPAVMSHRGRWTRSRGGNGSGERGNTGSLIG